MRNNNHWTQDYCYIAGLPDINENQKVYVRKRFNGLDGKVYEVGQDIMDEAHRIKNLLPLLQAGYLDLVPRAHPAKVLGALQERARELDNAPPPPPLADQGWKDKVATVRALRPANKAAEWRQALAAVGVVGVEDMDKKQLSVKRSSFLSAEAGL